MSPPLSTAAPGSTALRPVSGRWFESRAGRRLLVAGPFLALGLVLLMMWGGVAWFSVIYPQRLMTEYQHELAASARAAAAQTEAVLRDAESNLRTVDLWLLTRGQRAPLNDASLIQLAETLRASSRDLVDVLVGRADGQFYRLPARTGQPFAHLPQADVVALLSSPESEGLVLGAPLRLREGGPLLLPLAMRMSAPSGDLSLLLAVIDMRRLAQLLQPYARGGEGSTALVRGDGLGLLRVPELPRFSGRDLFADQPQRRGLLAGARGSFITPGRSTDGLKRLASYETLPDFNVKVLVAQGLNAALGSHGRQRNVVVLLSLGITVIAVLITQVLNRLQRQARERDAMLAATSDASPLGLFRCDASGALTYANDTYLALHGMQAPLQPWGWLELLPAEQRDSAREQWRTLVAAGEAVNVVRRVRQPNGDCRRFAIRTAPLRLQDKVVGAVGSVDDVTERAAQLEAQRTLHAIFDQTPDYICQFDPQGGLIYLNPAGRQRLGLAAGADLQGRTYRSFLPEAEGENFLAMLPAEALEAGHWQGRSTVRDPRGLAVPVASTILVHRGQRGQVETVSVLLRDISAHEQALRERERSEAMTRAVTDISTDMISILDLEQRLLFCNPAFEQHFKIRREDWLGQRIDALQGAQTYALHRSLIEAALAGQTVQEETRHGERPEPLVHHLHYAPLRREDGTIEGVVCFAHDISSAKAEEERLRDASQTDPLTQLLNRSGFELRADEQFALARQHDSLLCLLYLDLDRFKPVNDRYGHPVGDALLRAVAGRLRHALRSHDLVARLGGDEFAVLLPALHTVENAEMVAAKLVQAIAQPFMIDTHEITVGVSVGYCVAHGGTTDLALMVAQADAKLYEAKRAGRGVYRGGFCG